MGNDDNGRWPIASRQPAQVIRRYRGATLILETRFETANGAAMLVDFMPMRKDDQSRIVRIVCGQRGSVPMRMDFDLRFDYGRLVPWISRTSQSTVEFVCGPHAATLRAPVETRCGHSTCSAEFEVAAGERKTFILQYRQSHRPSAALPDPEDELGATESYWRKWASQCTYRGPRGKPYFARC